MPDPISIAILIGIGLWILAAPDPITASTRSGAAQSIGSGARAARQSIAADMRTRSKTRLKKHQDRLDRWAGKKIGSDGEPIPAPRSGRMLLKLDRVFGRGGAVESAGRRAGAHLKAAGQAAAVGWRDGKQQGTRGLPKPAKSGVAWVREQIQKGPDSSDPQSAARPNPEPKPPYSGCPTCGGLGCSYCGLPRQPSAPEQLGGSIEGNSANMTAQTISTEAGLLPVAEQIVAATAELGALIEAAEASIRMSEGLSFDPGEEVKAAMSVLAESTPLPDTLRGWSESATGLKSAVENQITALAGA
jgi:hypothetical protein